MSKLRNILLILSLILLSGGIGYRLGKAQARATKPLVVVESSPPANSKVEDLQSIDFSLFWQVWNKLGELYIDKEALDPQKMVYGAISGMVASLDDPYTVFLPPKENEEAKDNLGGKFEGIGAQLGMKEKRIIVVAPLAGMPAERAGVKSGDWIIKVNGEETEGWSLPKAVSKIRGPKGSTVTLTILHQGEEKPVDISIVRDTIQVPSVEGEIVKVKCSSETAASSQNKGVSCSINKDKSCSDCLGVYHLKLMRFGDQTVTEWNKAVNEIVAKNCNVSNNSCRGVILDLRNNPGGYLQGAVYIASEFLSNGLILSQQASDGSKQDYLVERKGKLLNTPLVVLVNQGSASASEIVAGALKVRKRAKLVGEKTFGKGSVQDTYDFPDGSGIHVTVARWLLPDGSHLNGEGVDPDVIIEMDASQEERDLQLEGAIKELIKP